MVDPLVKSVKCHEKKPICFLKKFKFIQVNIVKHPLGLLCTQLSKDNHYTIKYNIHFSSSCVRYNCYVQYLFNISGTASVST